MENVVVTGATSMVGVALINSILKENDKTKIFAVVRPNSNKIDRLPKDCRVKVIECDFLDYGLLTQYIDKKCDVFYHLAWTRTATYQESYEDIINKQVNIRVELEAVKVAHELGCKKFVGAGTQAEYGIIESGKINEYTPCNPVRADGILHLAASQLAEIVAKSYGMTFIWTRIFSVYGTNDRSNSMIMSTIDKMITGTHCSFTPSEQLWDYLYEDDIGEALYLIGEKCVESKVYCIGNGKSMRLKQYINIIREVVSPDTIPGFGEIDYPKDAVMNLSVDISKLNEDTGWLPKTEFKDGICKIYEQRRKVMKRC